MMQVKVDMCEDAGPAHETGPWSDIAKWINGTGAIERVAILNRGTVGGRPSAIVAIKMPTGEYVAGEITGDLWETIAGAIRGARSRWGVPDRP